MMQSSLFQLRHTRAGYDARALYEQLYCARGEAENRIGKQFELFTDRASSATVQANQLRMWFSAMAYVLVDTLRRVRLFARERRPGWATWGNKPTPVDQGMHARVVRPRPSLASF